MGGRAGAGQEGKEGREGSPDNPQNSDLQQPAALKLRLESITVGEGKGGASEGVWLGRAGEGQEEMEGSC